MDLASFLRLSDSFEPKMADSCVECNIVTSVKSLQLRLVAKEGEIIELHDEVRLSYALDGGVQIPRGHCHKHFSLVHYVLFVSINTHDMTFPRDILAEVLRLVGCFGVYRSGVPSTISDKRVPFDSRVNDVALMRVSLMDDQEITDGC